MWHIWMSHVTPLNEYQSAMSHIWMRHVTHMPKSPERIWMWQIWMWSLSHGWMSHVTHAAHMNESYHTFGWVWMRHVTHMNEACHTYEWGLKHWCVKHEWGCLQSLHTSHESRQRKSVISHVCMSTVTPHCAWVMTDIWISNCVYMVDAVHIHPTRRTYPHYVWGTYICIICIYHVCYRTCIYIYIYIDETHKHIYIYIAHIMHMTDTVGWTSSWYQLFISVTCLIHMCDMTHFYFCHDACIV